ncbi:MAG: type II toxin-antitoxin system VapC family toxin [Gemmatimonadales bacterium]
MNLLLDTHVMIWWDEGARLSVAARQAVEEADEVYVSAASAWEIAIKASLGRIRTSRRLREAVAESGFAELPLVFAHAERVAVLPRHHGDPFDRILIAQALEEDLVLVSRDSVFAPYEVRTIRA